MNRIFTLLLALLACTVHVSAQNSADTLRGSAAVPGDSLIAVDEQALIERLAQLYRDRRAQNRHNLETADYLRTQLLYNLLDGRTAVTQPLVSAPAYTPAAPSRLRKTRTTRSISGSLPRLTPVCRPSSSVCRPELLRRVPTTTPASKPHSKPSCAISKSWSAASTM